MTERKIEFQADNMRPGEPITVDEMIAYMAAHPEEIETLLRYLPWRYRPSMWYGRPVEYPEDWIDLDGARVRFITELRYD